MRMALKGLLKENMYDLLKCLYKQLKKFVKKCSKNAPPKNVKIPKYLLNCLPEAGRVRVQDLRHAPVHRDDPDRLSDVEVDD